MLSDFQVLLSVFNILFQKVKIHLGFQSLVLSIMIRSTATRTTTYHFLDHKDVWWSGPSISFVGPTFDSHQSNFALSPHYFNNPVNRNRNHCDLLFFFLDNLEPTTVPMNLDLNHVCHFFCSLLLSYLVGAHMWSHACVWAPTNWLVLPHAWEESAMADPGFSFVWTIPLARLKILNFQLRVFGIHSRAIMTLIKHFPWGNEYSVSATAECVEVFFFFCSFLVWWVA